MTFPPEGGVWPSGVIMFLFRRIVQDKEAPHWREETPSVPERVEPVPEAAG